jgi:putative heme-binding domain-containing protein
MNRCFLILAGVLLAPGFAIVHAGPAGAVEKPFIAATNPPPIQMLVPGFTVRELPLNLNNINNLAYAPDGRLFALGYDGNVYQLKDTDGDGLEDTASFFFKNDHNEILPSIGMTWGPGGLYIASRGRVLRLRDKGDGTAALETIASGWVEPAGKAGSGLDSIGIAVDKTGTVFFGLGCDNWMGAYRVNKETGKSDYNLHSDRGTIQKLSPDWKKREAICTGIRFTVSLAFNANGDLFATDQEGATWLPNGNPFDELLNIQPGSHYGFPPRHPQYLPDVIDEPSVFDYAPQHQSTCGLHFNLPVADGKTVFGPAWWQGDAIVSGESRGKIWRTKLVKTAAGYIAKTDLIACLDMLTIDSVPTPQGDLIVTCHGGKPDWGTGPEGKGKLFKISYSDKNAAQPVLAYAVTPTETRVVFDRPLDPAQFKNLANQSVLSMGRHVSAGDRFESFRPGYQVVKDQDAVPRYELAVLSAGLTADNRTLVLQTAPRVEAVNYAVELPDGSSSVRRHDEHRHELPQQANINVLSDLTGVEAHWQDVDGKTNLTAWLPHFDLAVDRALVAASQEHTNFFKAIRNRGFLKLKAQLDLSLMLHPVTQPGAKLDYEYPPETVTVVFKSISRLGVETDPKATVKKVNAREQHITICPKDAWLPVEITLATGKGEPVLEATWFTDEDPRPRAFPLRRTLLPWAVRNAAAQSAGPKQIPEIAGGDWNRGKQVFLSEPAACFKCHQFNGQGGHIGPDLSNLPQRDYASVLKDITQPSAAINPDHLAYNVELKNGEAVNGVILEETPERLVFGQVSGQSLTVDRKQIATMKASSVSLMPEGLLQGLNPQQQKDLLTFLLMEAPKESSTKP